MADARLPTMEEAAVVEFSKHMLVKLRLNSHKGGWENETLARMLKRLNDEVVELTEALDEGDRVHIIEEAADVANFAMFIADIAQRRL